MQIIERRPAEVVGFLGARRTGKTSLMREVLRSTGSADKRIKFIIYDFGGQFVSGREKEGRYIPDEGTLADSVLIYQSVELARKTWNEDVLQYQYFVFPARDKENYHVEVIDFACEVAGITLVLDEVDQYSTKHALPNNIQRILNVGRHIESAKWVKNPQRGVSLMWAARRTVKVHNDFVSASGAGVLFLTRTIAQNDLDKISAEVDYPLSSIRDLENGQFLRLDQGYPYEGPTPLIVSGLTPYKYDTRFESKIDEKELETPSYMEQK